jgi:hypothetical protein
MYHSPGLRDGVILQGIVFAPCPSQNPRSGNCQFLNWRFGNKFNQTGVLLVIRRSRQTPPSRRDHGESRVRTDLRLPR